MKKITLLFLLIFCCAFYSNANAAIGTLYETGDQRIADDVNVENLRDGYVETFNELRTINNSTYSWLSDGDIACIKTAGIAGCFEWNSSDVTVDDGDMYIESGDGCWTRISYELEANDGAIDFEDKDVDNFNASTDPPDPVTTDTDYTEWHNTFVLIDVSGITRIGLPDCSTAEIGNWVEFKCKNTSEVQFYASEDSVNDTLRGTGVSGNEYDTNGGTNESVRFICGENNVIYVDGSGTGTFSGGSFVGNVDVGGDLTVDGGATIGGDDVVVDADLTAHHANTSTDHDDRYYTEAEITSLMANKEDSVTEGSLTNNVIISEDIKDGEVGTDDLASTLNLSAKTVTFGIVDSDVPDDITITESDPNALLTAGTDNIKDTHLDFGTGANQISAADIPVATTNFDGHLSGTDSDLKTALETVDEIDAMTYPGSGVPQSTGSAWGSSLGLTTTVGSPGSDTNIVSEQGIREAISGAGGMSDLADDSTPQLGGNLDIVTYNIEGVDATEFGYVDGVTSDIQTQINAKQATLTADSIGDTLIDWGTGAGEVNATDVPADASGLTNSTATDVQGVFADLDSAISAGGTTTEKDLTTASPLSGGANNVLVGADGDVEISIVDAAADGTTKGAATFNADHFNASSGVITLDTTNGPYEINTSNDIDPDRLDGDTTDDNLIDEDIISDSLVRSDENDTLDGDYIITGSLKFNSLGEGLKILDGGDLTGDPTLGGHEPNDTRIINLSDLHSATDGALLITRDETTTDDHANELIYLDRDYFECLGNEIWHAGNDGSGSGLDADTIDGSSPGTAFTRNAEDVLTNGGNLPDGAAVTAYVTDNFAQAVDDYDALKAITGMSTGDVIRVTDEGIFGDFVYDSADATTGDDGIYIEPTSGTGCWTRVRKSNSSVNVQWYGITPDTAAATNTSLLNTILEKTSLVDFYFPGTNAYEFNDEIEISRNNAKIYGDTAFGCFLEQTSSSDHLFVVMPDSVATATNTQTNVEFKNVTIYGQSGQTTGAGILAVKTDQLFLDRVFISKFPYGLQTYGCSRIMGNNLIINASGLSSKVSGANLFGHHDYINSDGTVDHAWNNQFTNIMVTPCDKTDYSAYITAADGLHITNGNISAADSTDLLLGEPNSGGFTDLISQGTATDLTDLNIGTCEFTNIYFDAGAGTPNYNVYISSSGATITGVKFHGCSMNSGVNYNVRITSNYVYNVSFSQCNFNKGGGGVYADGNVLELSVNNCLFKETPQVAGAAFLIGSTIRSVKAVNNTFTWPWNSAQNKYAVNLGSGTVGKAVVSGNTAYYFQPTGDLAFTSGTATITDYIVWGNVSDASESEVYKTTNDVGLYGDVSITGDTTFAGDVILPTSCSGLSSGALYNNSGTPAICP